MDFDPSNSLFFLAENDRALLSEGRGHRFESCRVRHSGDKPQKPLSILRLVEFHSGGARAFKKPAHRERSDRAGLDDRRPP